MACLRLVTRFPERPERSWPRFISCMARSTFAPALCPYRRGDFRFCGIGTSCRETMQVRVRNGLLLGAARLGEPLDIAVRLGLRRLRGIQAPEVALHEQVDELRVVHRR